MLRFLRKWIEEMLYFMTRKRTLKNLKPKGKSETTEDEKMYMKCKISFKNFAELNFQKMDHTNNVLYT